MPIELKVPTIGESVSEIYIGKWYKAEGDAIAPDEGLVELESDKATLDVPSPSSGVLTKILKQTGDTAQVGEVIAYIENGAGATAAKQATPAAAPAQPKAEPPQTAERQPEPQATVSTPAPAQTVGPVEQKPVERPRIQLVDDGSTIGSVRSESSPVVQHPPIHASAPKAPEVAMPHAEHAPSAQPATDGVQQREEESVPLSPVRRRIASRLVEAQHTAALLTTFNEIDMSAVKDLRANYGESFQKRHHVKLGFMSFFVKATIESLRQCPELNAIIEGDRIVYRRYYDIGVAIGSDRGLVVPILRNAETMSFAEIEAAIEDLAKRAQSASLKVDELQGGTFTITNGGVYGSLLSTPIVNPPQSGVLGMHSIQNRPVAVNDQVVIRPMMYVALTYDHRIVDGREAVTFLRRIKEAIEAPERLLLEV
jgi:2-oxoglutarate dehydrogenase E2 component (dihydrolipoamide succinyltransferase)